MRSAVLAVIVFLSNLSFAADIDGFKFWSFGKDPMTSMVAPAKDHYKTGAIHILDDQGFAHAKFKVKIWGEMYTSLLQLSRESELPVDISKSRWVEIEYAANRIVTMQLRHAFTHGGTHNHVLLDDTDGHFVTVRISFSDFKGGLKPLDLTNVSKFDFAMVGKNESADFSEIKIKHLIIDGFNPQDARSNR